MLKDAAAEGGSLAKIMCTFTAAALDNNLRRVMKLNIYFVSLCIIKKHKHESDSNKQQ